MTLGQGLRVQSFTPEGGNLVVKAGANVTITVEMQSGEMAMVPWLLVTYLDTGATQLWNCKHLVVITLEDTQR